MIENARKGVILLVICGEHWTIFLPGEDGFATFACKDNDVNVAT